MEGHGNEEEAGDDVGLFWLPAELWAMVCGYLGTGDLACLSTTCYTLRSLALAKVRHHTFAPLGLITRRKSMRQALTFTSSWPALVSLDLTAWDSFSDSLVQHLPETLESLNVSYTAITNRGLARLPMGLTHLDVSSTQVTGHGLRCLSRLTTLHDLNLASTTGLRIEHLQWIPSSVEVLDLSFVWGPEIQLQQTLIVPWPPGLTELKLCGARFALSHLYGMPTTLTSLDLSYCYLYGFNVDFDVCLPRLETLRANRTEVIWGMAQQPPLMWSLPSGLKSLSFSHATISKAWDLLAFLPASITSLDFSFTRLAYEQGNSGRSPASLWFETLPKRLPRLRLINLAMTYARNEPQCLKVMQAHSVQVVCPPIYYPWVAEVASVLPQGQFDTEARPREDVPEWQALVRRCAQQRELLSWQPVGPPHSSDAARENEQGDDDDDDDDEEGDGDDEQGSLLFLGL